MDTISIKGKKVKLDTLPQWFLKSEAHSNPDYKLRQQALQILKIREEQKLREAEKLTSNYQLKQNNVLPSSVASSSDSDSLSKQSGSSQSSLASSSESFLSKLH